MSDSNTFKEGSSPFTLHHGETSKTVRDAIGTSLIKNFLLFLLPELQKTDLQPRFISQTSPS